MFVLFSITVRKALKPSFIVNVNIFVLVLYSKGVCIDTVMFIIIFKEEIQD